MNKINNIENDEIKNSEASESHFDDEGHKKLMDQIRKEKAGQKERDLSQVSELNELLLKNEKMPINGLIEKCRKEGLDEEDIAKKLIIQGYSWDEFMNSSIDKKVKSLLEDFKKDTIENSHRYIFRFKDKEDLSDKYLDILRDSLINNVSFLNAVKNIPLKRAITIEDIRNGEKKLHERAPDNKYSIDLSGEVLPDLDWSQSREVFDYLSFDNKTFSQTSKEHLPEGYDPKEIFEKGKSIGLGIDDVHKMGYTGKGIGVAICDRQLKPHKDINTKEYVVEENAAKVPDYMHASAVGSILAGKQTGIAPDSDLYFFAKWKSKEKNGGNDLKSAFTKILKKNQELPNDKKIRVISISGPLFGEGIEDLVKQLEDSGVWIINGDNFSKDFGYLEKKDLMGDPNEFDNYQHCYGGTDALFVNSGNRTVGDPKSDTAYRYDNDASASWAIPAVAGYYVLACQVDPTMTPDRFKKLARETAHEIDSTIRDEESGERSKETRKIKVIDIKALIQKIEEDKK